MKDPAEPGVFPSSVEPTDSPVLTTEVSPGEPSPFHGTLESIVQEAFDANAGRLTAFALAAVHDRDIADDLVQETFLRFVREVRRGPVPDNVAGWLYRVLGNLVVSRGRRRSVAERMRSFLVDRSTAESAEDHVVRSDDNARLGEALTELPRDARVALLMAAQGFSAAEIGETIGRTPGATATYICRARIRLRERLAGPANGSLR